MKYRGKDGSIALKVTDDQEVGDYLLLVIRLNLGSVYSLGSIPNMI